MKKDAPSGTALEIRARFSPPRWAAIFPWPACAAGYIPGTHELGFDSEADTVILRHTARGRQGFAEGALSPPAGWWARRDFTVSRKF